MAASWQTLRASTPSDRGPSGLPPQALIIWQKQPSIPFDGPSDARAWANCYVALPKNFASRRRYLRQSGTTRSGAHNVHNHPSQHDRFSSADELITQRLKGALDLIDVRVVDHLLVAGANVISLAESGLL